MTRDLTAVTLIAAAVLAIQVSVEEPVPAVQSAAPIQPAALMAPVKKMKKEKPVSNDEQSKPLAGFPAGMTVVDVEVGTGDEAVKGKTISVHYTGRLLSGKKFDSSLDRGKPFQFNLGARQVIQGWDLGFAGMKVGGKRQLTLEPEMGYGDQDMGVIPPNSTLVFDVELLGVK